MRRGAFAWVLVLGLAGAFPASSDAAEFVIGAGGSVDLGSGHLDLGCADLTVGGTLSAGSVGLEGARNVAIDPSGVVNGNSATVEVAGDWDNAGSFSAGTSTLRFVDGCAVTSATVSGDTTFATLDLTTTTGKLYRFAAGSTQTVTGLLTLQGAAGNRLELRSTLGGSEAFLDLQGGSSADFVDVADNEAIGNPIYLGPHSILGSNAAGWLLVAGVPAFSLAGHALLVLAMVVAARGVLARLRTS